MVKPCKLFPKLRSSDVDDMVVEYHDGGRGVLLAESGKRYTKEQI
jgi:hypothetical protein